MDQNFFMRTFIALILAGLYSISANAQQVTGIIKDSDGKTLNGATITLLRDSVVIKLGVTNASGPIYFCCC